MFYDAASSTPPPSTGTFQVGKWSKSKTTLRCLEGQMKSCRSTSPARQPARTNGLERGRPSQGGLALNSGRASSRKFRRRRPAPPQRPARRPPQPSRRGQARWQRHHRPGSLPAAGGRKAIFRQNQARLPDVEPGARFPKRPSAAWGRRPARRRRRRGRFRAAPRVTTEPF